MEFEQLVERVLDREGGYVNHPDDRGGPTNYGITQRIYGDWLASKGQLFRNVRDMTKAEARQIYFELYWKNSKANALPSNVQEVHFDAAINHGVRRAALLLQAAAAATQDGAIGPKTLAAVAAMDKDLLLMRYLVLRYRFYGDIIKRDRKQLSFITGWLDRIREFS